MPDQLTADELAESDRLREQLVETIADLLRRFSPPPAFAYAGDYYGDFARRILDGIEPQIRDAAWDEYRRHNEANRMEPPGSWERVAWEQKAHWQEQAMLAMLRVFDDQPDGASKGGDVGKQNTDKETP